MSIIHELAEASRREKIKLACGLGDRKFLFCGSAWDIPSFNFGIFTYRPVGSPCPFEGSAETALLNRVREMTYSGFLLPFPRCAFIFREAEGPSTHVRVLEQVNGRIFQIGYHRSFESNGVWSIHAPGFNFDAQLMCGFPTLLEKLCQE